MEGLKSHIEQGLYLADHLIIPQMLERNGEAVVSVSDRVERFRLTAQYRNLHPGGIAEALSGLAVDSKQAASPYVFDGLRGVDEVRWAGRHFSASRFVALDAPDSERLRRMLGRSEPFDRTAAPASEGALLARIAALDGVGEVFSPPELYRICADAVAADHADGDVVEKTAIIIAERRSYDSRAAVGFLERTLSASRLLSIDTTTIDAAEVARRVCDWI